MKKEIIAKNNEHTKHRRQAHLSQIPLVKLKDFRIVNMNIPYQKYMYYCLCIHFQFNMYICILVAM